jgi:hypothetical protein
MKAGLAQNLIGPLIIRSNLHSAKPGTRVDKTAPERAPYFAFIIGYNDPLFALMMGRS